MAFFRQRDSLKDFILGDFHFSICKYKKKLHKKTNDFKRLLQITKCYFRDDAPGVLGGLTDDSISFEKASSLT